MNLRSLATAVHWIVAPRVFVPVIVVIYVAVSFGQLHRTVARPKGQAGLVSGDAKPYLAIAETFAGGDWSMDYVAQRPHRQPLYPALLSPVIAGRGRDLFWLASVNIAIAALALAGLHRLVLWFSGGPVIAAVVSLLYVINPFLLAQTTRRLLTEPLHVAFMIVVVFALLQHVRTGRTGPLLAAAAAAGLDYLTRPNGLFVMAAMLGALAAGDIVKMLASRRLPTAAGTLRRTGLLAAATAVFLVVTIPSWLPRWLEYGRPFHHGYLTNYLWVDTYEAAHVGMRFASYDWHDYAATHSAGDAAARLARGVWMVALSIPFRTEEPMPALFLLAVLGAIVTTVRGPPWARVFLVFVVVQLLPLMWTNLSNPTERVPYGAVFPLELALATLALMALRDVDWHRIASLPPIAQCWRPKLPPAAGAARRSLDSPATPQHGPSLDACLRLSSSPATAA